MSISGKQNHPQGPWSEDALASDWLVSHLRWLWLVSLFGLAWLRPATDAQNFLPVFLVIGAGVIFNLIQAGALYARWYPDWMRIAGVVVDTGLSILLLAFTGRWSSPLVPATLFPVLVASLRIGLEAGLSAAVVILFAYGAFAISDPDFRSLSGLYQVGVNALLLVGVACVGGLLNRQQKAAQERVESTELRSLRRANERARAIYEMASTLSATLNYERVLTTMLNMSLMGLTEVKGSDDTLVGLILLFEEEGNPERLRVQAGHNMPRADERRVVSGQSGLISRAIYTAEPAITDQASSDQVLAQFVCMQHAQSAICAPLRAGFDSFGVVVFASSKQGYFTEEHSETLMTFCNQAVIALKNAQLYQDLQVEQRKILEKESEARHKLARDLHDGPTQTISAVAMRLNFIRMMLKKRQDYDKIEEEVAKVEELARKTAHEVRTMLFTLRPVVLETQGLAAALDQYAERLCQTEHLNVQFDPGGYDGQLDKQTESVVFSVVEEAVGNARKHAHANQIMIRLRIDDYLFSAEVQDDGVGFELEDAHRQRDAGHFGLLNIQERAELVGGRCLIESQPGAGTLVRFDIPMRRWGGAAG
ncbi:MAG: histidine kinase [Anaerolineae bacterium]